MKFFSSILVLGERSIFGELARVVSVASEANLLIRNIFKTGYNERVLEENTHTMRVLERKADDISFGITHDIISGAVNPNIIENLIDCVQLADDIVDLHYFISREMNRMSKADSSNFVVHIEDEMLEAYGKMFALSEKMLSKLQEMLATSDTSKIMSLRTQIEELEEQGDDIKDAGFDDLYVSAPKLHFLQFFHHNQMLHRCDDILDSCEDLSDTIVSVVTSLFK